jgi:hypothetical protein
MNNCMPLFYLCLALLGVLLAMLAMFFKYNLELGARTVKLEQKNGKEEAMLLNQLKEIAELRKELAELKTKQNKHDHE